MRRCAGHASLTRPCASAPATVAFLGAVDAAINPGNSGGPVFDQSTNLVVGVAFAGAQRAHGVGYIIPVMVVRRFLDHHEQTGRLSFGILPQLGIEKNRLARRRS